MSQIPAASQPGNDAPPANQPKTWKVGTLTYTKFGLVSIFAWLLWGDLVFTLTEAVFPQSIQLQLGRLHISQAWMPILTTVLGQAVALPMNPYLSFRSDRYRSRWGRRIPYIFKTMIPLAIFMSALGFSDEIGEYIRNAQWLKHLGMGDIGTIMVVMACLILLYDYFNIFINTIYWYLFADVIPKELMGRFFSLFRIMGMAGGSFFGFFIQRYIETQTKYIYMGAAVLYVLGFGLMCWKVREGDYPPPKDMGPRAAWYVRFVRMVKVYFEECFRHPVHISFYATSAITRLAEISAFGMIFFYRQHLHITQAQLGAFNGIIKWPQMLIAFPLGWLVDKIHPMRATLIGMALIIPLNFANFYMDSFNFYILIFCLRTPFTQLIDAAGMPLSVSIFPRKQYGQFGSANGMVRSLTVLIGAFFAGWFINFFVSRFGNRGDVYSNLWMASFQAIAFGCMFVTYLYWKKHGAENFSFDPEKVVVEGASIEEAESPQAVAQEKKEEEHPETV
jgi:maltose/moltooligosaccharide transporter